MKKSSRKAQLKISFGMIFSIILIIIFLAFGFWAIKSFLSLGGFVQLAKFSETLQNDVDKIWRGQQGSWSPPSGYNVGKIQAICFIDYFGDGRGRNVDLFSELNQLNYGGDENLVFYPISAGEGTSLKIEHIDIKKMTAEHNPYCVNAEKSKMKLTVEKNYGENLVTIY